MLRDLNTPALLATGFYLLTLTLFIGLHFSGSDYNAIDNMTPLLTASALPQGWLLTGLRYITMISLFGVVVTVFRPLRRFFGRVERVFILSTLVWFLVASFTFIG